MSISDRIEMAQRRLGPGGDCDPAAREHLREAILWADEDKWQTLQAAWHRGDMVSVGHLLRDISETYWRCEALV